MGKKICRWLRTIFTPWNNNGSLGDEKPRRALALVLSLCLFALSGCGGGDAKKEKIYYFTHNGKAVFGSLIQKEFNAIAQEHGQPVEYFDAQKNSDKQIAQIEDAVQHGAKRIILLAVDEQKIVPTVEKALDAGVEIVAVNRHVRTDKICGVYSDEYGAGEMQAEYMARNLPLGAHVFYLQGPADQISSKLRWEGFRDHCLAKRPDLQLMESRDGNYSREEAHKITEEWMRDYTQIDAIVSANDEMALGALAALKEKRRSRSCMISSIDATDAALQAIADGEMRQTIKQDAQRQAQGAYQLIEALAQGETRKENLNIPLIPITKENLSLFLNKK